jgi:hypothetical protein
MIETKDSNYDSKAKDDSDLELETTNVELGNNFPIIFNDMENGDFFIVICNKYCICVNFEDECDDIWYMKGIQFYEACSMIKCLTNKV